MHKRKDIWGAHLLEEHSLSSACIVFGSAAFRRLGPPPMRRRNMKVMSPAVLQQRLNRRVSLRGLPHGDHANRWRQGAQDIEPILVVVADATDRASILDAKRYCARASREVVLAVLLLVYPDSGSAIYPLDRLGPCITPGELAGDTWCTLELLSERPYLDALHIADALTLRPGLIGVDFVDVQTLLGDGLSGARAYHRCNGGNRADKAAMNVLRELAALGVSMTRASGLFVHITSGLDLKLAEIRAITGLLRKDIAFETDVTLSHAYKRKSRLTKAPYLEVDVIVTFAGTKRALQDLTMIT